VSFSVLLRLLPGPLAGGQVVGELEVVRTGERVSVRSVDELMAQLRRAAHDAAGPPDKETK
jgi:hypothetical protein